MNPLVSVIVPVFNAEDFIFDCLESIRTQNYENLEIIVVDDASTDLTRKILLNYQNRFFSSRVKIYYNSVNLGVTKNCNLALSYCKGKYVCFFAGDDVMFPGKISAQVFLLEENCNFSFCYHDVEVFDSRTNKVLFNTSPNDQYIYNVHDLVRSGGLPGANSVMARRDFLPVGGYDISLPKVSDWKMFIDLAVRGGIGFLPNCFSRYRKHSGGLSARANEFLLEYHETLSYYERLFDTGQSKKIAANTWRRVLAGAIARDIFSYNSFDHLESALSKRSDLFIKTCLYVVNTKMIRLVLRYFVVIFYKLR